MDRIGLVFPELLAAAQDGRDWAWDRLVRCYGPAVLGYVRSQGVADPDELLGDVLVELVKGLPSFAGEEHNFRSWVFVIAHNRIVDARRRAIRRPTAEWPQGYEPAYADAPPLPYDLGDLKRSVDALPQLQRDVLLLRTVVGLSVDETAEALDKSAGSVRVAHHRALQRLRHEASAEV